ncbi:MAG: ATP-binding protein [Leptolyngbyaceae cyanobacterium bins.302]|nr:ATP-binding protein [Leptolyngbyaceae cyanobacterium bins.302]
MLKQPSNQEVIEHIRRRPGMYFGNAGVSGVEQFVYELVSNVIDTYLANQATLVSVKLTDASIKVTDDGTGLPFDESSDIDGISLATKVLTHVHWTRSWDEHAPHIHISRLGLGLAPLTAASAELTVTSWRSGKLWEQKFSKGFAQTTATIVRTGSGRGTSIEVTPDPELFGQARPRPGVIRRALFEAAHLFSKFAIEFQEERFWVPNGLQDLAFILCDSHCIEEALNPEPFHITFQAENILVEAAAFGSRRSRLFSLIGSQVITGYISSRTKRTQTRVFSWVNGARTPDGGSHVEGFLQALSQVGWKPALILIHVVMYEPEYAGPIRTKLNVPHIREFVCRTLLEPLHQYQNKII